MRTANKGVCEHCGREDVFTVTHNCEGLDSCFYCVFDCPDCGVGMISHWLTSHEIIAGESW